MPGPSGHTSHHSTDKIKLYAPIQGAPPLSPPGSTGDYGNDRGDHIHAGNDIGTGSQLGVPCIAPCDGTIDFVMDSGFGAPCLEGGMVHFRFDQGVGSIPANASIGWGHAVHSRFKVGDKVKGGDVVCVSNCEASPHVHFTYQKVSDPSRPDGSDDPREIYNYLINHDSGEPTNTIDPRNVTGAGGAGSLDPQDIFSMGRAAAISTEFELPGLLNYAASRMLKGDKSIFNDQPLLPFIQQLAQASLRHFQSLPDGTFFAFYPDYFGSYNHRKPYWKIEDIEIVDGGIQLNDEALATHVFVVGDTVPDGQIQVPEQVSSKGVVTIFDAFASNFMFKPSEGVKKTDKGKQQVKRAEAMEFLKRYGVRPHYEEATFIRNHMFELFYAFTQFQLLWSRQFLTQFSFTFMPELYPGGVVAFENHGFRCYIDSVTHTFDYTSGFITQANLSAPAAWGNGGEDPGISQGMIKPLTGKELHSLQQDVNNTTHPGEDHPSGVPGGDAQGTIHR